LQGFSFILILCFYYTTIYRIPGIKIFRGGIRGCPLNSLAGFGPDSKKYEKIPGVFFDG
jgi:hypothetical protein